jgi:hypothetical protein
MDDQMQRQLIQKHADLENAAFYSFCDRVITLSTGALALSITFRSSFSAAPPVRLFLLKVSWVCFTLAILAALVTHIGRIRSHKNVIRQALKNDGGVIISESGRVFRCAIWVMYTSFFLAILSLAAFAFVNLK